MRLEEIIEQDFTVLGTGRWLRTSEHDSLVIDTERQLFYWNSKDMHGGAFTWLTVVKGLSKKEAEVILGNKTSIVKPYKNIAVSSDVKPYDKLVDIFYKYGKNHRDYWYNVRHYTDETIDNFKLGYTGEWYTIPIYVNGEFKNFQCRNVDENGKRVVRPWYYGIGALPFNFSTLAITSWTVLTEGPPDAIMLRQMGIPAVSQTVGAGYWNSEWLAQFKDIKTVYIVYDNDLAGNNGSIKAGEIFGDRARIYNMWDFPDGFDITNYFAANGTKEEFLDIVKNKSKFHFQLEKKGKVK